MDCSAPLPHPPGLSPLARNTTHSMGAAGHDGMGLLAMGQEGQHGAMALGDEDE